jgi:hypothetical protein
MRIESLYTDVYQVIDDNNSVLYKGSLYGCISYLTTNTNKPTRNEKR